MKTYQLQITINEDGKELYKDIELSASDINELSEKLDAFETLNQSVAHDDLISTVDLFNEKPERRRRRIERIAIIDASSQICKTSITSIKIIEYASGSSKIRTSNC